MKLTAPTVHLNGTSGDRLMEALEYAYLKITEATDAVGSTAPNGRDYYVRGSDAYGKAAAEHDARVAKLLAVKEEIELLIVAVHEQLPRR